LGGVGPYLIAWPSSTIGTRAYKPGDLDGKELLAFDARLRLLLSLPLPTDDEGALEPPVLRLSQDAFDIWRQFHDDIESELGGKGEFAQLPDFGAKAAEQAVRIACVLHVFEKGPKGEIGADHHVRLLTLACRAWDRGTRTGFALLGRANYGLVPRSPQQTLRSNSPQYAHGGQAPRNLPSARVAVATRDGRTPAGKPQARQGQDEGGGSGSRGRRWPCKQHGRCDRQARTRSNDRRRLDRCCNLMSAGEGTGSSQLLRRDHGRQPLGVPGRCRGELRADGVRGRRQAAHHGRRRRQLPVQLQSSATQSWCCARLSGTTVFWGRFGDPSFTPRLPGWGCSTNPFTPKS
jgi:Protein of unknown function (DUF3987)